MTALLAVPSPHKAYTSRSTYIEMSNSIDISTCKHHGISVITLLNIKLPFYINKIITMNSHRPFKLESWPLLVIPTIHPPRASSGIGIFQPKIITYHRAQFHSLHPAVRNRWVTRYRGKERDFFIHCSLLSRPSSFGLALSVLGGV